MPDIDTLQGTWKVIGLVVEGQTMSPAVFAQSRIIVDGERFESVGMGAVYKGTLTLDAGQSPKTFDLNFQEGPETGNPSLGIYELSGDTWTICLTTTGKQRPTEFRAPAGSGHALETLQKA
jgi:uncharacterized protein (TIGR03067 family)